MDVNLDTFARQLGDLIGRFGDLGEKLGDAARELQDSGAPPAVALVDALAAARQELVEVRAEIMLAAETLGIAVPDGVESAKHLEPLLVAIADALDVQRRRAAFEQMRAQLVTVLDHVEGIRHQDDDNFGPLVTVKLKAAEAKRAVLALTDITPERVQSLVTTVQPFADLLSILGIEGLDDQNFAALEQSVARAFGRQIALTVTRRRLLLPGQSPRQPERAAPPAAAPEATAPEVATPEPVTHEAATPEPVTAEPAATEPVRLADAIAVPEPVRVPEPEPVRVPEPEPVPVPATVPEPEPVRAPEPEPTVAAPPPSKSGRTAEPKREPTPAPKSEPEPQPVAARAEGSTADETAQWWLAAWARWSGWKNTLGFPEAVREELAKYPYLLSVPIQQSPEFEEGLLAYGYSIILEHVEKQKAGSVGNALNSLKAGEMKPVGTQLYEYLVAEGKLTETYPEFIKNVLRAALPEPGPWAQARMIHSKDDTRVFRRPTPRLGETEQTAQRFLAENQRFKEHKFEGKLAPLTTRFFFIQAELKDAHGVEAKLTVEGAPSDAGFVVTLPAAGKATKMDVRRLTAEGTPVPGIGRDYGVVWFAVFNADPARETDFELGLTLRKDTRGMKK